MKMLVEMKKGDNRQSQETKKKKKIEGKLPGWFDIVKTKLIESRAKGSWAAAVCLRQSG